MYNIPNAIEQHILLFADTFDHSDDAYPQVENCDVIKFRYPVSVSRVTVVPPNTPFEVLNQTILTGCSKPNNFKLETFINNLSGSSACSASVFTKFCDLNYDVAFNNFTTNPKSPSAATDMLVIKGKYKTCTICVFGYINKYSLPQDPPQEKVPHLSDSGPSSVVDAKSALLASPVAASLQLPASLVASSVFPSSKNANVPIGQNQTSSENTFFAASANSASSSNVGLPSTFPDAANSVLHMDPELPGAMRMPFTPPNRLSNDGSKSAEESLDSPTKLSDTLLNGSGKGVLGETDEDSKKWMEAADLFLRQAAEAVESTEKTSASGSANSKSEVLQPLTSLGGVCPNPEVPVVDKAAKPAPNPVPNMLPPMLNGMPPGMSPAAVAALAAAGLPFPMPPFNMGLPPFFNPAAMEHVAKLYGNPAAMMAQPGGNSPFSMGQPNLAALLTGSRVMQPQQFGGGCAENEMGGGGCSSVDGFMPNGSVLQSSVSSIDEDYDDLSADDLEDEFEDASDDEALEEDSTSQPSLADQQFLEQQQKLEEEEERLFTETHEKLSQPSYVESMTRLKPCPPLNFFKSPHLYLADRMTSAEFDEAKHKQFTAAVGELQKATNEYNSDWVVCLETLYEVCLQGFSQLKKKPEKKKELFSQVLKLVVANAVLAVDWEGALNQKLGFNVRQIKVGCRLVTLLAQLDEFALKSLLDADIFDSLFNLVCQPLMVSTMKLFALEAIDSLCCSSLGIKKLLMTNGFARLLEILENSRCMRINHAISLIASKINIFECLQACHKQSAETARKLRNVTEPIMVDAYGVSAAFEALMDAIEDYPCHTLITPPGLKKLEVRRYEDFIFRLMSERELLEQVQLLLASPLNQWTNSVATTLLKLFDWLMQSNEGRTFLTSKSEILKGCVEFLTCSDDDELDSQKHKTIGFRLLNTCNAMIQVDKLRDIALQGIEKHEEAFYICLEQIYSLIRKDLNTITRILKDTETLNYLSTYVVKSIKAKCDEAVNIKVTADQSSSKRSVSFECAQEETDRKQELGTDSVASLKATVESNHSLVFAISILEQAAANDVSCIESWALILMELPIIEDASPILRAQETPQDRGAMAPSNVSLRRIRALSKWLEPVRDVKLAMTASNNKGSDDAQQISDRSLMRIGAEHIPDLVYYIKHRLEEFGGRFVLEASGMISCLRIILRLLKEEEHKVNLNACIAFFEASGYDVTLRLINSGIVHASSFLWKSHQLNSKLDAAHKTACFELALPLLEIVKIMIGQLTLTDEICFRDMRFAEAVVALHSIASSQSGNSNEDKSSVKRIRALTVDILLMYTKGAGMESGDGCNADSSEEDDDSASTWSLMLSTVISHINSSPNATLAGWQLLSELLPLPLPMVSPVALEDIDLDCMLQNRKSWASNVLHHTKPISKLITQCMDSASVQLCSMVQKVAWQIADLSPELSQIVVNCFITQFLHFAEKNDILNKKWIFKITQILKIVDHAVSQPAGKAAFLQMLCEEQETLDCDSSSNKATECLNRMLAFLDMDACNEDVSQFQDLHNVVNYYVITILQSLCDPSVSLVPFDHAKNFVPDDVIETNTPPSAFGELICDKLFGHACSKSQNMFTFHHVLKTIVLLCCHDHVFSIVRTYLNKDAEAVKKLLTKLHREQKGQRDECNLKSFLSFLNLLRGPATATSEDFLGSNRTVFLKHQQLFALVGGASNEYSLEKYYEKLLREGVSLGGDTEDSLKALIGYLNSPISDESNGAKVESGEDETAAGPSVYPRLSLAQQFLSRCLYRVCPVEDERFSPANWFSVGPNDVHLDHLMEMNLKEACRDSLPREFDPLQEYRREKEVEAAKLAKKYKHRRRYDPLLAKGSKSKNRVRRPNYLAKEKGVDFGPKRTDDVFRLRKQNTSRPPSMHVDDFMLLERAENQDSSRRRIRTLGGDGSKSGGGENRKRNRLSDSPSGAAESFNRPIPSLMGSPSPLVVSSGSSVAVSARKSTESTTVLCSNNVPNFISASAAAASTLTAMSNGATAAVNERGFYSSARGWLNHGQNRNSGSN